MGVLDNLDIGVAIPFISLSLEGTARAVINSTTLFSGAAAINVFNDDPINPILENTTTYTESTAGLGDIALRLKYVFVRESDVDVAAFVEIRLPTGDEKNFLGTGKTNARFTWILTKKGDFSPHFNLSYDYRGADFDSDEIEFNAGFNHRLSSRATLVFEVIGEYDVTQDELTRPLLGTETLHVEIPAPGAAPALAEIDVDLSNLPHRDRNNEKR